MQSNLHWEKQVDCCFLPDGILDEHYNNISVLISLTVNYSHLKLRRLSLLAEPG